MSRPAHRSLRPVGIAGLLWGAVLLGRGAQVFTQVQGRGPSSEERTAITLLGVRHLGQGVLQVLAPHHLGSVYAGIDVLHASSMVAIAAKLPALRRAALTSGAVAGVAGLLSLLAARPWLHDPYGKVDHE